MVALVAFPLWGSPTADAAIYLGSTRLIMDGKDKDATIKVVNDGEGPVLLQVWIDTGDSEASPEKISTPFTVATPILRLESKRSQRLRVLYTGSDALVPSDRESAFWLNVLEVPPKAKDFATTNHMQMAFRTRIKLFYRPQSLPTISATPHDQLRFSAASERGDLILSVTNPTPIHQTLLQLSVGKDKNHPIATTIPDDGMLKPFGSDRFILGNVKGSFDPGMKIFFSVIDDFGTVIDSEQPLTR
ncbi:fimbrial biogenesis chaperone [Edaphovirga cremea]|uniref:fimbrial biogenesis chaperone n=1 Tax=Edaphovirga cremea TaxID=2267246 RepID=UPI001475E2F2|nr:fimbria/pilus periplasmic chaperone [Edaphovirga cremea]